MISKYILLFTLCSVVGWVYESIYALIVTGKWENRGFLYGPLCPIYGFGVVGIVVLAKAYLIYAHHTYTWWQIALVAFFGSMLLEYFVSWLLEQLFHAYWWDYKDMPLNINGRTCIPAGMLFALGGVAAVEIISPWWDSLMAPIPLNAIEAAAFIIVFLIAADATLTVSELTTIQQQVAFASKAFHARADELTGTLVDKTSGAAELVKDNAAGAVEAVKTNTAGAVEAVKMNTAEAVEVVKSNTVAAAEVVKTNTAEAVEVVKSNTAEAVEAVKTNTAEAVEAVKSNTVTAAETVATKLAEQKDRLQEDILQTAFDNMNDMARMALSRVEGFRLPQNISAPDVPAFTKNLLERAKAHKNK